MQVFLLVFLHPLLEIVFLVLQFVLGACLGVTATILAFIS